MKKRRFSFTVNTLVGLFIIGVAVFYYFAVQKLNTSTTYIDYGPGYFPRIIDTVFFIIGGLIIVGDFLGTSPETKFVADKEGMLRILILVVTIIAYLIAMKHFGFIIPSIVFFGIVQIIFGEKNKILWAILTVCFPLFTYVLFQLVLGVILPR